VHQDHTTPDSGGKEDQAKVISVEPGENGDFDINALTKGLYEVRFGNRGHGGYNIVSLEVGSEGSKGQTVCGCWPGRFCGNKHRPQMRRQAA
jgi:hypothetical protein